MTSIGGVVSTVLAHAGGWDELALVGIPVAIFGLMLRVAHNRARTIADHRDGQPSDNPANDSQASDNSASDNSASGSSD